LSVKGFGRGGGTRRPLRLPAIDEALFLFALSLVLLLFMLPPVALRLRLNLVGTLALVQAGAFLLPALVFARLLRWQWRDTFAWRPAPAPALLGAALMGVGLPWIVDAFVGLQSRVLPSDPDLARRLAQALIPSLAERPVLTVVGVALIAAVTEEMLFRGPIQTALARRLPGWAAIGLVALLFGAVHGYAQGMLPITLVGLLLGWLVWRGGSLWPALVLHFVYDATKLAGAAWLVRTHGHARVLDLLAPRSGEGAAPVLLAPFGLSPGLLLAGGALLVIVGGLLCHMAFRRRPDNAAVATRTL
jgi:membrane protease YdiL (CAAX protease family)